VEKYVRAGQATDETIIPCMRFSCWVTNATDTHTEYSIFIAFPRQQWLLERSSVLGYTYIACLFLKWRSYSITVSIARQLATSISVLLGGHVMRFVRCNLEHVSR
jgi:hypothetical protein